MAVFKKTLVIEPWTKPRYTLAELLAKARRNALTPSRRDRDWLSGGPVGKEAI
jgi:antitoxin component of MazEF toxin-antitoxin module